MSESGGAPPPTHPLLTLQGRCLRHQTLPRAGRLCKTIRSDPLPVNSYSARRPTQRPCNSRHTSAFCRSSSSRCFRRKWQTARRPVTVHRRGGARREPMGASQFLLNVENFEGGTDASPGRVRLQLRQTF